VRGNPSMESKDKSTGFNFALIGVAGYIAPRHLEAIKATGNNLVAAMDPNDSVGILDRFFPEARYFPEFERFDRYAEKLRRGDESKRIDYVSICSPNYLHDAHIRFALRIGANVICEKPLVLNPWNLDALQVLENETHKSVSVMLQLRVHPALRALKEKLSQTNKKRLVELTYVTPRGPWYNYSWKGQEQRSGGLATNIGIHLFDLLIWLFGGVELSELHLKSESRCAGFLELENAKVKWLLSVDKSDLPVDDKRTTPSFRSLRIDGEQIEFSDGFTDLHTTVYRETLLGNGFNIDDARPSIELAHNLRVAEIVSKSKNYHPALNKDGK
jgi:UDP-N-acetyl-2-amino-2-deoxyglucuronate dehydrogenase